MSEGGADVAASVLVRPDPDRVRESAVSKRPPEAEPVGECPHCHHDLERRQVTQAIDIGSAVFGGTQPARVILLTYWGCTNELCCSMFWRQPQAPSRRVYPLTDVGIEH